jgi:O-antigen/teichoic acid export membrane protein
MEFFQSVRWVKSSLRSGSLGSFSLPAMIDPQATFRSALWNHAGRILEYILMYLTSVLIARGLGVLENGTFVGLFSASQLLLVLTSFGLEVSLNKHLPQIGGQSRDKCIRYVLRRMLLVRVLALLSFAVVLYVAKHFFSDYFPSLLSEYIWVLLVYTSVRSVVSLFAVVLTADLQTRATSGINVVTKVLEVVLIGLMVSSEMTTMKVFTIFLSTGTLQLSAYVVAAKFQLFGRIERQTVSSIIAFGGIYWINTVGEFFLGRQGDVLLLTLLLPNSTQASLYDVAFAVSQLASLSMTIGLGGITLATSAKLALRESELLERFYGFMIRMTSLLSIPLYAFILFNATSVLFVLYSSKYVAAAGLIQGIAAFRIAGRLFGGPENAEFLLSRSRVTKLVGIGVIGAFVNVGLDLVLIPRMNAMGAVVGSGCANLIVNLLGALAVYRSSSAKMQWQFWLKVVAVTGAASLVCNVVFTPQSPAMIVLQVLVYLVLSVSLLLLVKPLTIGDREWLSRIDNRLVTPFQHFAPVGSEGFEVKPT